MWEEGDGSRGWTRIRRQREKGGGVGFYGSRGGGTARVSNHHSTPRVSQMAAPPSQAVTTCNRRATGDMVWRDSSVHASIEDGCVDFVLGVIFEWQGLWLDHHLIPQWFVSFR